MANGIHQWRILKNHGNILKIYLFGQITKQQLANFSPENLDSNKRKGGISRCTIFFVKHQDISYR